MDTSFTENTSVNALPDGFVALSVERNFPDGISYRSVLYFQAGDAAAVATGLERFKSLGVDQTVTLADGTLRIFAMEPSPMVNLELDRDAGLAHGGYDTLDLGPDSVGSVVDALRAAA